MNHFIGYAIAETFERPWGQVYGIPASGLPVPLDLDPIDLDTDGDNVLDFRPIRDELTPECGE